MKNRDIAALFRHIQENGLFTNAAKMIGRVYDKLISDLDGEDGAKFIPTLGEMQAPAECSECRKMLPWDRFTYYQARVKSDGTLMRSNALCKSCSEKLNLARKKDLGNEKENIPAKPKSGDVCPNCSRKWTGNWHRDHDYKTGEFIAWICGQCNMAMQDRRTPNQKLKKARK